MPSEPVTEPGTPRTEVADRVVAGDVPPWVAPVVWDPTFRAAGADHFTSLLNSCQLHAELRAVHVHCAMRLESIHGVQSNSQWRVEFAPRNQRLVLHFLRLLREGARIDQLALDKARILQREAGLEKLLVDGCFTCLIVLEDVRPGDILEWAYTVEDSVPFLAGLTQRFFFPANAPSVGRHSFSVLFRDTRALAWKGSAGIPAPVVNTVGDQPGLLRWFWEGERLTAPAPEPFTPASYLDRPWIQVSDTADWSALAAAILQYYTSVLSPAVLGLAAEWSRAEATAAGRVGVAIDFVQRQCRYLSVDLGSGGAVPAPPDLTLERRYGDCKDLSLALVSLLKALGVEACVQLVNSGLQGSVGGFLPAAGVFNHAIVEYKLDGGVYWVDPTCRYQGGTPTARACPHFGLGLALRPGSPGLVEQPKAAAPACFQLHETLLLDTSGAPSLIAVALQARGLNADALRLEFSLKGREAFAAERLKLCAARFANATRVDDLQIRDDPVANEFSLAETFVVSGFLAAHADPKSCSFRVDPAFNRGILPVPPAGARRTPLAIAHPCELVYSFEVESPGMPPFQVPAPVRVVDPHFAFSRRSRSGSGFWSLSLRLSTKERQVPPERLDAYRQAAEGWWNQSMRSLTAPRGLTQGRKPRGFGELPAPSTPPAAPRGRAGSDEAPPILGWEFAAGEPVEGSGWEPAAPSLAAPTLTGSGEEAFGSAPRAFGPVGNAGERRAGRGLFGRRPPGRERRLLVAAVGILAGVLSAALHPHDRPAARLPSAPTNTHRPVLPRAKLQSLADAGNPRAQLELGRAMLKGDGLTTNIDGAVEWLKMAADQGLPDAAYEMAMVYERGLKGPTNHPAAADWLEVAAKKAYPDAEVALGVVHLFGLGRPKDGDRAWNLLKPYAERERPDAERWLGWGYAQGAFGVTDAPEAVRWLTRSASHGDGGAAADLARFYVEGRGVTADAVEAYAWACVARAARADNGALAQRISDRLSDAERAKGDARVAQLMDGIRSRRAVTP